MPYVPVPKDLSKVKNKIALGMTLRQLVCLLGGIVLGVPTFFLFKFALKLDTTIALWAMMLILIPFIMLGFFKMKDGSSIETYLKNYIRARYLRPRKLVYATENAFTTLQNRVIIDREYKRLCRQKRREHKARRQIED